MGNLYGHKITAFNGVLNFLEYKYPESQFLYSFRKLPECKGHFHSVNLLMIEFRKQNSDKLPSQNMHKNAEFVQRNWNEFRKFLKDNHTTPELLNPSNK